MVSIKHLITGRKPGRLEELGICFVLAVVIGLGLLLYLTNLAQLPGGFYVDEASIGVNALGILESGQDEHGVTWPVYFKAFGEYKNPLYIYSLVPVYRVLGVSIETTRLASALWGLLGIGALALLMWLVSGKKSVVLLTVVLALFNPWYWLLSRVSFEVISLPVWFLLTLACWYRFDKSGKYSWFYYGVVSLGVGFYSYTAARFLAPMWLVLSGLVFLRQLKWRVVVGLILFACFLTPALMWESHFPGSLGYAFNRVAGSESPAQLPLHTLINYPKHWSLEFLLLRGDGFLRHMIGFHSGLLWVSLPFLVLGLWRLGQTALTSSWSRLVLLLLLLSPIPSAVTTQAPHGLRSITQLVLLLVVLGLGVIKWWQARRYRLVGMVALLLVGGLELAIIRQHLVDEYQNASAVWFDVGAVELFQVAQDLPGPYWMSHSYDPALLATWRFISTDVPIEILPESLPIPLPTGTFLLDSEECDQLLISNPSLQPIHHNYQGCAILN